MSDNNRDNVKKNDIPNKPNTDEKLKLNPNTPPIQCPLQHNPFVQIECEMITSDPFYMFHTKQEL